MRNLRMPAHYAEIDQTEQRVISGGDAIGAFLDSLHLTDFYRGSSVFSITFTFVPALLFTAVRTIYDLGQELVGGFFDLIRQL